CVTSSPSPRGCRTRPLPRSPSSSRRRCRASGRRCSVGSSIALTSTVCSPASARWGWRSSTCTACPS
ncbi:MAG: hypothetical protein AVDCRST_MAG54-1905, partial [uncultured Actinomycetospora sp.]